MMNKILIVEDEFSISNFMKTVLEGDGYTVEVATCAAQARAALEKMEFSAMLLDLGLPDADGLELLRALLPERRRTQIYQAEPYVLAADVYAAPGHLGRGGWSWYTGAAGWYYRTAVEELLGLKVREGRLFVEPHLPEDWPGWTGEWELDRGRLSIQVSRGRELSVRLDGREIRDGVPLRELTGDHRLEVTAAPGNGKLCFSAKDVV